MTTRLILASASPRRLTLLRDAGYEVEVDPSGIDEPEPAPGVDVEHYVVDLAWRKARTVAKRHGAGLVLAADTACEVNGVILNKPRDRADAERMIMLQETRDTRVLTGICLYRIERAEWLGTAETSVVRFRELTIAERSAYLDSGRWQGKAGAYGVQDHDPFIEVVSGSWSNVVGLPLERLNKLIKSYINS